MAMIYTMMWVSNMIQTDDFPHSQHVGCRTLTVLAWMQQKRCCLQERVQKAHFYPNNSIRQGAVTRWLHRHINLSACDVSVTGKSIKNVVIPFIFRLNECGNTPLHASAPPLACWDISDGFEYHNAFIKTLAFLSKRLKTRARLLATRFGLRTPLSELILENEYVCICDFSNVKRWG